jgi:LCP family protein required for cell wall assembly
MVRTTEPASPRAKEGAAPGSQPAPGPAKPPPLLPRRRWDRRILIALNVIVALSLLGAGGAYGYVQWKFGSIHRIDVAGATRPSAENPGKVMNVLMVGSDTRSNLSKTDQKQFGSDVSGSRSDTIMILHVDPKQTKAAILSLPRDLYVPIASGGQNKINAAFNGGPQNLIDTITKDFGIPIDHYIEVDFNGFRGIVNAVGDINVYFSAPARDIMSNLDIPKAGCIALNPDQALSYVRSRDYEYYEGGRWHTEGDGDLGRIQRQQDFIRRVLRKVKGVRNPLTVNQLIDTGIHNVTIDKGLSANDIFSLASKFQSLSPDTVDMETLPTVPGSVVIGGLNASILRAKQPDAQELLDKFNGKEPPPAPPTAQNVPPGVLPSTVRVRVLNGSGVAGQATKVASELGTNGTGFNIAGLGDADSFRYIQSVITYGPGQEDKAKLLQAVLKAPAQLKSDPNLKAIDLTLVVGSDYSGVLPLPGSAATAPTTTAPATPSTTVAPSSDATGKSPADSC